MNPLFEIVGNGARGATAHIAATCVNVGVIFGFTVMVIVAVVAQCQAVGVNVYAVVLALFNAGVQFPVIPLFEVVGKAERLPPAQIAAT